MNTLFIVFGRSCTGKTTAVRKLQKLYGDKLHEAVSITTREQRPGEIPGVDYNFVDKEYFEELLETDALVEHITYNGNHYGLEVKAFDPEMTNIVIIEPNGLKQVKEKMKDRFNIIVIKMDENDDTLLERFIIRGDAEEVRNKRIYGDKTHFADVEFNYLVNSEIDLLKTIITKHSPL